MPSIREENKKVQRCFNLARSFDILMNNKAHPDKILVPLKALHQCYKDGILNRSTYTDFYQPFMRYARNYFGKTDEYKKLDKYIFECAP